VAVASAGPYASLHLAPDRQLRQHPTTQIFTGRMPFLPPNQQRQSTEGVLHLVTKLTIQYLCDDRMTMPVLVPEKEQRQQCPFHQASDSAQTNDEANTPSTRNMHHYPQSFSSGTTRKLKLRVNWQTKDHLESGCLK